MESGIRSALESAAAASRQKYGEIPGVPIESAMFKRVELSQKLVFEIISPLLNDVSETSVVQKNTYELAPSNMPERRAYTES